MAVRRGVRAKRSTDRATEAIGEDADAAAGALLDQRDSEPAGAQQHIVEAPPSEEVLFHDRHHEGGRSENEDVERGD